MKKHKDSKYGFEHIHYDVFKSDNGNVYLCEDGILANENVHLKWEELFEYLNDIGYKIEIKDG